MIKRIIFFISLLHFLRHDQREKNHLVTTPWSREKRFSILALRSMRCGHRKRNLICIALLLWLRYDHEQNSLFYFPATFTLEISSYMILHLSTTLNTLLTCRKNSQTIYSPEKTCVTCEISSGISMEPCMIYVPT